MEADENGVTAKNTYGGPLLLRTVFHEDGSEETYQYLYNAHGDVVTLLTDGAIVATYYYDSFGNILEQTGDVDNTILYAGYQYDVETGLYYINARMYDPVTARFLQADTYLGYPIDPLSLNLYTYCLNNPHKYVDPSGHSVVALLLMVLASGVLAASMEYFNQRFIEQREVINYDQVLRAGLFNAAITIVTFGFGSLGVTASMTSTQIIAGSMAFGAAEGALDNISRQMVDGVKLSEIDYGQVALDATIGAFSGGLGASKGIGDELVGYAGSATKGNVRKYAHWNVGADDVVDAGTSGSYTRYAGISGEGNVYSSGSKTFYTVQNSADAKRLLSDGLPWPTEPYRANLGDGIYAWSNIEDASHYFNLKSKRTGGLQILEFEVSQTDLNRMKRLDLTKMSDDEVNMFLDSYARLNGGTPNHGYDYIQRMTGLGVENYFNKSIYEKLKFKH